MITPSAFGERLSVRHKGLAVIALPLIALILTLSLSLLLNAMQVQARGWVDHSYSVRRVVRNVSQDLRNLDLVRADSDAFPPERGGVHGILGEFKARVRELGELVDDNEVQAARVTSLSASLDSIETSAIEDPFADFRTLSRSVHGELDEILAHEENLLAERRAKSERLERYFLGAIGVCAALGLLGSWLAITIQSRSILNRLDALGAMARVIENGGVPNEPKGIRDEFGVVASALHKAGLKIVQREEELRQFSARLEELVDARTAELLAANRRLKEENQAREEAEASLLALTATLEAQVQQRTEDLRQSNQELESFSYSVSHDLRAPLRHVSGFVALLERSGGSSFTDTQREYINIIGKASTQMGRLIDDLLAFSRVGRVGMTTDRVDLKQLAANAWASLAGDIAGRQVQFQLGDLPTVMGDSSLLHLVLVNLMSNAIKFSRPRDAALIEVDSKESPDPSCRIFFVRDNGVGYDPKYKDRLFQVFQRLHRQEDFEGTGIGLANVARIIHRHGGHVWSESQPGAGACFYFSLPIAKEHTNGES